MRLTIFSDDKLNSTDTHTDFYIQFAFPSGSGPWNAFRVLDHTLQLRAGGAWSDTTTEYLIEINGLANSNNYQTISSGTTAKSNIVHLANNKASSLPGPWVKVSPFGGELQEIHVRLLGKTTEGTTTNSPLTSKATPDTDGNYGFAILVIEFENIDT